MNYEDILTVRMALASAKGYVGQEREGARHIYMLLEDAMNVMEKETEQVLGVRPAE